MRFVSPARHEVERSAFAHPLFAGYARHRDLLEAPAWPGLGVLNERLGMLVHPDSGARVHFAAQTPQLLADGLHYEERISRHGAIATREESWHDLLNALAWIEHPALKLALSSRQARDVACVGAKTRTRGQCALTHFDEAGTIVLLREPALLDAWDAHDWHALFWRGGDRWRAQAEVVVFGHALLEHALRPGQAMVAKSLVVQALRGDTSCAVAEVAARIASGALLADPQELRPLPLAGVPGWDPGNRDEAFYRCAPCLRPLRSGRRYPAPLSLGGPS